MLCAIESATLSGVEGRPVTVEVHVSNGLPGFAIVGLPDAHCRESRDRVRAALLSCSLNWTLKRVTVNLAPSGERKNGGGLDLPIAIGLLVASEQLPHAAVENTAFFGELGLDGRLRSVPGLLALVSASCAARVVVPADGYHEAALLRDRQIFPAYDLAELVAILKGLAVWSDPPTASLPEEPAAPELGDVRGQPVARTAIEVAAAGGHHLLLSGPPGAGKTMLAQRMSGLLPALDDARALETTRIHSAAGLLSAAQLLRRPPFRAPHHSASVAALVGGGHGGVTRPGELSLATNGILFLDELAEFPAHLLDALRTPLQDGVIRVARAHGTVTLPARCQLVGAMNPCFCGEGPMSSACTCTEVSRLRYERRVSAALLDRFELRVGVERVDPDALLCQQAGETTAVVGERVAAARSLAMERGVRCNAELPGEYVEAYTPLSHAADRLLRAVLRAGSLSGRGAHGVRRVARTLVDLKGSGGVVTEDDLAAALALRADATMFRAVA